MDRSEGSSSDITVIRLNVGITYCAIRSRYDRLDLEMEAESGTFHNIGDKINGNAWQQPTANTSQAYDERPLGFIALTLFFKHRRDKSEEKMSDRPAKPRMKCESSKTQRGP
ncbi:hypothetical protein F2P81_017532 [Scophthalmus maximus]|uniref:Uncharacterized protein n=1 Tax=Scophthalmus maximus TaxID=52904 RepID=A0A6A4SI28_SCOMX|nr:hypothetical protein F2P81_017532 [Scophthalmus maximus]